MVKLGSVWGLSFHLMTVFSRTKLSCLARFSLFCILFWDLPHSRSPKFLPVLSSTFVVSLFHMWVCDLLTFSSGNGVRSVSRFFCGKRTFYCSSNTYWKDSTVSGDLPFFFCQRLVGYFWKDLFLGSLFSSADLCPQSLASTMLAARYGFYSKSWCQVICSFEIHSFVSTRLPAISWWFCLWHFLSLLLNGTKVIRIK